MQAPFSWANVRTYCPIFQRFADKMVDRISQEIHSADRGPLDSKNEWRVVELSSWISRCTLDVIGAAGFDYSFEQLDQGADNKLANVFAEMLEPLPVTKTMLLAAIIVAHFPWLTKLPTSMTCKAELAMKLMREGGHEMLEARKAAAEAGELEEKLDVGLLESASPGFLLTFRVNSWSAFFTKRADWRRILETVSRMKKLWLLYRPSRWLGTRRLQTR